MTSEGEVFEEPQPTGPRRGSYSRRIALAFAAVAALTALLAALLLSAVWNYQFDRYVRDNLQRASDGVAQIAAEAHAQYGGWTFHTLSFIPRLGMTQSVVVQILDSANEIIYDESVVPDTEQTGEDGERVSSTFVQPEGPVVISPIVSGGVRVGTVRMWARGTGALMSERDEQFRRGSFLAVTVAALVAIVLSSIAGTLYSRRLVKPIETITDAARALRSGDRDARTSLRGEDEISVLGTTFDEMADAIEADRQMERRLTADVAHELRTPLQAIQATVEAMQDGVLPADEERLGTVRDETVRLGRLADAILELTRLERGALPFEMSTIDLAVPVRSAVDAVTALVESRDLTLSVDIAEGVVVRGDPDRLQQAVGNLLSNAARYTPAGGRIEVRVTTDEAGPLIEVSDTGIGIAEEDAERVFSRFWRADTARATATGGLGIGLAVTKEIVERHRGTIGVDSAWGSGTRFTVRLPKARS